MNAGLQQMALSLTDACDLACKYCVYSGKYSMRSKRGHNTMSPENLDAALGYFVAHGEGRDSPTLGLYGGEPTLAFDLVKYSVGYLERAKGKGRFNVTITSNFAHVTREMMHFVIDHDVWLYVSLDGPRYLHDRYRVIPNGGGTFDGVMANLRALRDMDREFYERRVSFLQTSAPPYDFGAVRSFFENEELVRDRLFLLGSVASPETVFPECGHEFFDASSVEALRREYTERVVRGEFNDPGPGQGRSLSTEDRSRVPNVARGREFLAGLFDSGFLYAYRRRILRERFPRLFFPGGLCSFGVRKLYVRWDGSIFPCERVPEIEQVRLGSVQSGFEIGKAFDFYRAYAALTADKCKECWAILQCREMCFREFIDESGLNRELKLEKCEIFKRSLSSRLAQMCAILERNAHAFDFLNKYSVK